MPPRLPTLTTLRQGLTSITKPAMAPLTTTPSQSLRQPTSDLLGVDPNNATTAAQDLYERMPGRKQTRQVDKDVFDSYQQNDYIKHMTRNWRPGDVYSPRDISGVEMDKLRQMFRQRKPGFDRVDALGLRPKDMYRNFSMISEFITPHGRIKHSSETGLRPVNQRKMAKAIRRAIGLGIHPSVHIHPEILMRTQKTMYRPREQSKPNYSFSKI
ncbi:ribosomal protein S18 [Poronia punctata]|nr:ribosomal protein S18 [Poronia punctata]